MIEFLVPVFLIWLIIFLVILQNSKHKRFKKLAKELPGHELSILSSIKCLFGIHRTPLIETFNKFIDPNFPLTKVWIPGHLGIISKDPYVFRAVLTSKQTYDKPQKIYNMAYFVNGLPNLNGTKRREQGKILGKAFATKMLDRLPKIFDEISKKFLQLMESEIKSDEINVQKFVTAFAVDSILSSNLNYDMEIEKVFETSNVIERLNKFFLFFAPFTLFGFNPHLIHQIFYNKKRERSFSFIINFIQEIIDGNKKYGSVDNTISNILLHDKHNFQHVEIRDQLISIIMGATETTSKTISAAIVMLGMFPEVQQKLMDEIDEIVGTECNVEFTTKLIGKFSYLEAVVNETLRLFSPVPFIAREVSDEMDVCGYLIPKGAIFVLLIHAMQRDEKYWGSDANFFRPERFLEGRLQIPAPFAPFSGGHRICTGYRYARVQISIFLINFLRTFKVSSSTKYEDLKIESTISLNIANGYNVKLEKR